MTVTVSAAQFDTGRKRNRFTVAPKDQRIVDGICFASKKEATRYGVLKLRQRIGEIRNLKCQPKFPVEINGEHLTTYTADFSYVDDILGRDVVEDVKSQGGTAKDTAYRIRKRAAELFYGIKVVEVIE